MSVLAEGCKAVTPVSVGVGGGEAFRLLRVLSANVDISLDPVFNFPIDTTDLGQHNSNIALTFRHPETSLLKVTLVDTYGRLQALCESYPFKRSLTNTPPQIEMWTVVQKYQICRYLKLGKRRLEFNSVHHQALFWKGSLLENDLAS